MTRARISTVEMTRYADLALLSFGRFGPLSDPEKESVVFGIAGADIVRADSQLLSEGQPLRNPKIVLAGWAARIRMLSDGRRQILSFVIPGDVFGYSARPRAFSLSPIVALTPVAFAPVEPIQEAIANANGKASALAVTGWDLLDINEALTVSHITRLGRQNAYERVAHLFLELYYRLNAVGLATALSFPLPLTQEILADALGLSVVHTNRMLQQLKRDGYIDYHNGTVRLRQASRLAQLVDFRTPEKLQKN
jgi:CRP-like cAMP-binding protein